MKGSCVCGRVAFAISGRISDLYQCHCKLCQKQTGSSSVTGGFVEENQLKWLSGESEITSFSKDSGYRSDFCKHCGGAVPNVFRTNDQYWIPAGALDDDPKAIVANHIFVASKAPWDEIGGSATQHDGFFAVWD